MIIDMSAMPVRKMRILGIDPGFASIGTASATITNGGSIYFESVACFHTEKDKDESSARDMFNRCQELTEFLLGLNIPHILCIEAMSYPRNASSATKLGASHGVIAAIAQACFEVDPLDTHTLNPRAARKVVTMMKKPTEEDAHRATCRAFPELVELCEGLKKKDLPHILDAAVQIHATDLLRAL